MSGKKIRIRPIGILFGAVLTGLVFVASHVFGLGIWEAVSIVGVPYLIGAVHGLLAGLDENG